MKDKSDIGGGWLWGWGFGYVGGAGGGGGGNSAAYRVLQSPAGVCSPLLYEANEKIPGYLCIHFVFIRKILRPYTCRRDRLQAPCAEFPKDDDRLTFTFRVMAGNWSQVTTVILRSSGGSRDLLIGVI